MSPTTDTACWQALAHHEGAAAIATIVEEVQHGDQG